MCRNSLSEEENTMYAMGEQHELKSRKMEMPWWLGAGCDVAAAEPRGVRADSVQWEMRL